ncbi:zinc-dependent alcohol dehydrogenase family protein [Salinarimonas ramus]|uniref:enoyl-[acyl-carrier-protein] reductase n=1 Tax=Salinarimonas ramus TaxID=690164 RepID=A0A917Q768_9HYPH|nr:zinc-dependent alcohol dehydrogenase family protein [Salinarimonas ramus]GGK32456.1 alcohol dehydrogenase [Salinarimonas ramus]
MDDRRRLVVHAFGPPAEVVRLERRALERPRAHEVRVRMLLSAINPSDLVTIAGAYPSRTTLPFVPGFEGVGVIDAVGSEVADLRPGDRVLPIGSAGCWQEARCVDASWCFRVPDALPDISAATSYVNPLTALLMMHDRIGVRAGMLVAIDAAGSAIGRMLVRLATEAGAHPLAIVRDARTLPLLDGLGVAQALVLPHDADAVTLARMLRDRLGTTRPHAVLDAVGGTLGEALHEVLAPGGRFVHYGLLSGRPLPPDLPRRRPDVSFELFWLRRWVHDEPRAVVAERLGEAWRLIARGVLASAVEAVHPLEDAIGALRGAGSAGRRGKILLSPVQDHGQA